MKKLIILIFLLTYSFTNAQTVTIGGDLATIKIGNEILVNNGIITNKIKFPSGLTIPDHAYYLAPDGSGNFTKSMVESIATGGETYIVFDKENLDVPYEDSPHLIDGWLTYLDLEIKATVENPVTLDFSQVSIDCYPSTVDELAAHRVFSFRNCENLIVIFGDVEGDKFKRPLDSTDETSLENTALWRTGAGTKNLTIIGGDVSGFMGDATITSQYGQSPIDNSPLDNAYYVQGDGRYESIFYDVNSVTYAEFGLTGGLGYNRLLYYDMEDITFKFYDDSEVFISEITGAKYLERYAFPVGAEKMKVNVRPMDGRTQSPTNFGHRLEYNPTTGTVIKDFRTSDNHRGGIANIGSGATIENSYFTNTQRYFDVPKFGTITTPYTTIYHINCEDVVSRDLLIKNCEFSDKFHKILLTHNISSDIIGNVFSGSGGNDIYIYDLLSGNITSNSFITTVRGGMGTNKGSVIGSLNTGSPNLELTQGAEWTSNNFTGGDLSGKGKCNNNTFTNYDFSYFSWTKDIHDNTFIGNSADVPYTMTGSYIYKNTYESAYFRFSHGVHTDTPIFLDEVTIDNTDDTSIFALDRNNASIPIVAVNSVFKGIKIDHVSTNQDVSYVEGSWYFEGCTFQDISSYLIRVGSNVSNNEPARFYFKDCIFIGDFDLVSTLYGGMLHEIVFDNCTIDPLINLNGTNTTGTVTMPTLVEPRTQPTPVITYVTDHVEIATDFHIMTLKIRNKNTLAMVLDEDVCSTYLHYTNTPEDFEYSIDGGLYWDEVAI